MLIQFAELGAERGGGSPKSSMRDRHRRERLRIRLFQYGGFASGTKISLQYEIPYCSGGLVNGTDCKSGSWQWIVNPNNTAAGNGYITGPKSVYNQVPPGGSCN